MSCTDGPGTSGGQPGVSRAQRDVSNGQPGPSNGQRGLSSGQRPGLSGDRAGVTSGQSDVGNRNGDSETDEEIQFPHLPSRALPPRISDDEARLAYMGLCLSQHKRKHEIEALRLELKLEEERMEIESQIAELKLKLGVKPSYNSMNPNVEPFVPGAASTPEAVVNAGGHDTVGGNQSAGDNVNHGQSVSNQNDVTSIVNELRKPKIELKTFGGDPLSYPKFKRQFETCILQFSESFEERLSYLEQYTTGAANKIVSGFSHLPAEVGYRAAMNELNDRYGDQETVANAYVKRALEWPSIKADNPAGLDEYAIFLTEVLHAVSSIDGLKILEFSDNVKRLVQKLPYHMHDRWRNIVASKRDLGISVQFKDLVMFVSREAKKVNDPVYGRTALTSTSSTENRETRDKKMNNGPKPKRQSHSFAAVSQQVDGFSKPCAHCNRNGHDLVNCKEFLDLADDAKSKRLRSLNLCYGCLKPGHPKRFCRNVLKCDICAKSHPTVLHFKKAVNTEKLTSTSPVVNVTQMNNARDTQCTLAILPVRLGTVNGSGYVDTYAFFDPGSTVSFVTSDLCELLSAKGRKSTMRIQTIGSEYQLETFAIKDLTVSNYQTGETVKLPSVYSKDEISIPERCFPSTEDIDKWPHLRGIDVAQLYTKKVGILIGNNVPEAYSPSEVRTAETANSPHACRTKLGRLIWNLYRSDVMPVETCNTIIGENESLHRLLENSIKLDFPENVARECREYSQEDQRFMKIVTESTIHTKVLLLESGHAEEVPLYTTRERPVWYLPHHAVRHPAKPDKPRVVFDCSAKYLGVSLNDKLLQGPDFTNSLLGVLLRFREYPIAIKSDIQKMFYQVKVPAADRDVLRFLWWKDGDMGKIPTEYRMTVHPFGAVSSPSCANYALRRLVVDYPNFPLEVKDCIVRNFYVDDFLKSVETIPEALKLVSSISDLCALGGFNLTGWLSNNRKVLESVERSKLAKGMIDDVLPTEGALGIKWCAETDAFEFIMPDKEVKPTRRGVLSFICSIYDPIGFLSPYILPGKVLLQNLTLRKAEWDETIKSEESKLFESWCEDMSRMSSFKIPRCCVPEGFSDIVDNQLHIFADASIHGYGMCAYIRFVDSSGKIGCSLVLGKARVAPLKSVSIPRLELTAAATAVKLSNVLQNELSRKIDSVHYWSDSKVVLCYIRNTTSRYSTFVANRIAVIRDGSEVKDWRHVPTDQNPADYPSRGLSFDDVEKSRLWCEGPDFLRKTEEHWPVESVGDDDVSSEDLEIKASSNVIMTSSERDATLDPVEYLRARVRLRKELQGKSDREVNSALAEIKLRRPAVGMIEQATNAIISCEQQRYYNEEFRTLQKGKAIKRRSPLYKFDVFIDSDHLLRVGGRIGRARIPFEAKHPIILPKMSHVSRLIIRETHSNVGHLGKDTVLARLRDQFWVQGGPGLVKSIVGDCGTCRRYQRAFCRQKMADLPQERLGIGDPPFSNTGVDYFGPFTIKHRRSEVKRYGVIFSCMTSRAVHLEIAHSLETDSCINAYRRFVSRRGPVRVMRSDNGTNLVGARAELEAALKDLDGEKIESELAKIGVRWELNPPTASHFGGIWERLIRSVRKVLHGLIKEHSDRLDDETLSTLMCEVECILNNRPLTKPTGDVNDPPPLTPNHLLLGRGISCDAPGLFVKKDLYVKRRWRCVQYLVDQFWSRWLVEYLPLLQLRQKWQTDSGDPNLQIGDVVLLTDGGARNSWAMGKVIETFPDSQSAVSLYFIL
ncbi:uncharacterized protein LOC141914144 [Tubulanus polymorphus]|uniref:uncharacterized protein LOC141914144 n=1 Tax=Tubulanus polymorphus TaxID=672921 RepID=UPI003DA283B5